MQEHPEEASTALNDNAGEEFLKDVYYWRGTRKDVPRSCAMSVAWRLLPWDMVSLAEGSVL